MSPISANSRATSAFALVVPRLGSSSDMPTLGYEHGHASLSLWERARVRVRQPPRSRLVHREFGLSDADALELYYAMLVSRRMSEYALKLAFQGAIDVS